MSKFDPNFTRFHRIVPMAAIFLCCLLGGGWSHLYGQSSCQITGTTSLCQNGQAEYQLTTDVHLPYQVAWQVVGGAPIVQGPGGITVGWPLAGAHQIFATITGGDGSQTVCNLQVNVLPTPTVPPLPDVMTCMGMTQHVSTPGCDGCTYNWTTTGALGITPTNQASANLTINGSGQYCVTVTDASGCASSTCGNAGLAPTEILPVAVAGATPTGTPNHWEVCPNQPLTFSVTSPNTMNWVVSDGTIYWNFTGSEMSFNFPTPGATDYTVTGTRIIYKGDAPGSETCQSIEPQYIHVNSLNPIPISCPSVVCAGDQVTYTVPAGCNGTWQVSSQGHIENMTATTVTVTWTYDTNDPDGYVIYNGTCPGMGFCTGPSIVQVPIIPSAGTINGPDGVCSLPKILTWTATNFVGGTYTWSYTPSNAVGVTPQTPNGPNSFKLKFESNFVGPITIHLHFEHPIAGCSYDVDKVIKYAPMMGGITGPTPICAYDLDEPHTYTFNYPGNLSWSLSEGSAPPFLTGNSSPPNNNFTIPANALLPGSYYNLNVTNGMGCSSTLGINTLDPSTGKINGPTTVCEGVTYTYTGTPLPVQGETFTWIVTQNSGNPFNVNGTTLNIAWPAGTGHLKLRRNLQGCMTIVDEIDITVVSPGASLVISGPDKTCSDIIQSYSVSPAMAGSNYVWTITDPNTGLISNVGSIYSGQGSPNIQVQWLGATSPTVVNLNVSAEICGVQLTATLSITVEPFHLTLETPDVCEGQPGQMSINASSGDGYTLYVDGHVVYSNSPNLLPIPALPAGTHTILLVVQNPNGCAGPATASSTLEVHPNASFKISLSDLLPCPKNTPFVRQLTVSPSSPNCSYQWYLNGSLIPGVTGPLLNITTTGIYTVVSHCGDCPSKSATLELKYDCGECCELDVPGNDILVDMKGCSLSTTECNLIKFGGKITPFALAHNPHWTIEMPGGTFVTIPITSAGTGGVVTGTYQATEVGIYRVYLSADEVWKDVTIRVPVGHGHYILFADFCEFEDAGGANTYPNYEVVLTGQDAYCTHSDYCNIQVPFIADFTYRILCNEDGTFQVHADDNSLYDTGVSATIQWTYPGGTGTGPSVNVPSVAALTQFDLCMKVTDQHGYSCSYCETIHTPAQVSPGIDVSSQILCQNQNFQFSPVIYPPASTNSVVSYHWIFGDGSFSYAEAPFKVYTEPGTYTVTLIVETRNGCFLPVSITVVVNKFELPEGLIDVAADGCNSSATLTFKQTAGPTVVDYLWTPAAPNTGSIVVTTAGIYGLVVTADNGCSNTIDPVNVDLDQAFPPVIDINNGCGSASASVLPNPNYAYIWSVPSHLDTYGATFTLVDVPGTYHVTVTAIKNGAPCLSKEFDLTIYPNPETPVVTQNVLCENGQMSVLLTATNVPAGATVLWYGTNTSVPGVSSITVTSNGSYTVQYTNAYGCISHRTIAVSNLIDFSTFLSGCYDCHILDNGPVNLNGVPGVFDSWYWEIDGVPSTVSTEHGTNSAITPLTLLPTYHKIRLCVTQGGCSLCSDLFCLIGDCNTPPCFTVGLVQVRCFDNGTANPADDYWNFDISVSGGPAGSYWDSGPPANEHGQYNAVKTIWPGSIAGSGSTYTLTLYDHFNPNCSATITVPVPAPCSVPCNLRASVRVDTCHNNGTPTLASDDFYYVTLSVTGTNGQCWMAKQKYDNGTEVLLGTFNGDQPVTLGPFNVQDGNWTLWVFICGQSDCVQDFFIQAPHFCSGCLGVTVRNIQCFDNGTSNPSDDYWTFDLLVEGGSAGSYWTAGAPVNQSGPYGQWKTIYMGQIGSFGTQINFTITDYRNPHCQTDLIVKVPRSCSSPCDLRTTAQVGNCVYREGHLVYYVTLTVSGTAGSCWMAKQKFNNGTENILGTYYGDQTVTLGPFDPSQGDWTLWVFICGHMDCVRDFFIRAPNCNTGGSAGRSTATELNTGDFQYYPSPVVSELVVKDLRTPVAPGVEKIGFIVSDMLGKPVFRSTEEAGGEYRLNLEGLTPGMYILQVLEQGKLLPVGRFVKI